MDISSSGDIMIAQQIRQSRLNMKSQIILYPLFFMNAGNSFPPGISRDSSGNTLLSLKISGTLQNPQISIEQQFLDDKDLRI